LKSFLARTLIVVAGITFACVPLQPAIAACKSLAPSAGVSVGDSSSYAWSKSGKAFSWGNNTNGQLGSGSVATKMSRPSPIQKVGGIVQISAHGNHALFLQNSGSVFSAGKNESGQLGVGTKKDSRSPLRVPLAACVRQIAAGGNASFALAADGTVWAWGYNRHGELNVGDNGPALSPRKIKGLSKIVNIYAGEDNLFAVSSSGQVFALGANDIGQFGNGTSDSQSGPALANLTQPKSISVGWSQVAAVDNGSTLLLWGDFGSISPDDFDSSEFFPRPLTDRRWKFVSIGISNAVAIDTSNALWSWGSNEYGALGARLGTRCTREEVQDQICDKQNPITGITYRVNKTPIKILSSVKMAATSNYFGLALLTNGSVYSWGKGKSGQLGAGSYLDKDRPTLISGLNLNK